MKKGSIVERTKQQLDNIQNCFDSVINTMSKLGTSKDKHSRTMVRPHNPLDYGPLESEYLGDWMAGKICDVIPEDATREWRTVLFPDDKPQITKEYEAAEKEFQIRSKIKKALIWSRVYGGGAIIPILHGDIDISKPFEESEIKKGSLKNIIVLSARECIAAGVTDFNPLSENYRLPVHYTLAQAATQIHHSRVLRVANRMTPRHYDGVYRFWGQSELDHVASAIINSGTFIQGITSMVHDLKNDTIKIEGLNDAILGGLEKDVQARMELYYAMKSMFNVSLLDGKETMETRQTSFQGLKDILEQMLSITAAATKMPVTKFVGTSAKGMNATGEGDRKDYQDVIKGVQQDKIDPVLIRLDKILQIHLWGTERSLEYKFNPLDQPTEKEQAETDNLNANTAQIYYDMNVLSGFNVAKELVQKGTYDNITREDLAELERVENEEPESEPEEDTGTEV